MADLKDNWYRGPGKYTFSGSGELLEFAADPQPAKDHKWVKPSIEGQAVWVWWGYPRYGVAEWVVHRYKPLQHKKAIVFVANHPEGLPPPDDYKGVE